LSDTKHQRPPLIFEQLDRNKYACVLLAILTSCAKATNPIDESKPRLSAASQPSTTTNITAAREVSGNWARSLEECSRPEFLIDGNKVVNQSDADGWPIVFSYPHVRYSKDPAGLIIIELGETHQYSRTPSNSALTFKPISSDEIDFIQDKEQVPFYRCKSPHKSK